MQQHFSVMLPETIECLNIKSDGIYVDLTLGRAGHSEAILKHLDQGMLIAFDKDKTALAQSESRLLKVSSNFKLVHSDYKFFRKELDKLGISKVDGIIADLGVSSPQLDQADRGFSYNKDARLDMRMNQDQSLDAHEIVNNWSEQELVDIFWRYADVMLPKRVAKGIVQNRPIESTLQLVSIIRDSLPAAVVRKKNPAKAVFQAIRMAVNEEISSLQAMLKDAIASLNIDGRLAVITFHSIEDRCVKKEFKKLIEDKTGKLPIIVEKRWKSKTYKPSSDELKINRRSRSAKLRVLTKLK